jgi:hypothetical protein
MFQFKMGSWNTKRGFWTLNFDLPLARLYWGGEGHAKKQKVLQHAERRHYTQHTYTLDEDIEMQKRRESTE